MKGKGKGKEVGKLGSREVGKFVITELPTAMGQGKTGLAERMRGWMKTRKRPFSSKDVCDGLGLPMGKTRDTLRSAMTDFLARGEIVRVGDKAYRYNREWKREDASPIRDRAVKGMYLNVTEFRVEDVVRLSGAGTNYVQKLVRRLQKGGYLLLVGTRPPAGTGGLEHYYRVMDRERFRKELMP